MGGTHDNAIGRSHGNLTTKVEALGKLVRFTLLLCQRHDSVGVQSLPEGITFGVLLGDEALLTGLGQTSTVVAPLR